MLKGSLYEGGWCDSGMVCIFYLIMALRYWKGGMQWL